MVGEVTGFLHIVRIEAPIDPVNAEYRVAFAPVGGRLRSRHVMVQAHVPTPDIERRGGHSPRDGSTRSRVWGSRQPRSRRSGSRQECPVASDL